MATLSDSRARAEPDAPSLEARPKAEARSIEDIVGEARKGRIRIPRFQRGLKWKPEDASLLFDSVYRGYPIGTLLFWQTSAEAEQVRFGSLHVDADPRSDAWWVVDGQQRLTSLVRVLLGTASDPFSLWFDLDEEKFVHATTAKKDGDRFLPLTEVLDTERLHQWVADHRLPPQRRKAAFRLNKRIREYSVPAYIVETADQGVLRRIFQRSNASGKRLKVSDVFDALNGARSTDEPANFKSIARSLEDIGFGSIDELVLHRALLAIHDRDPVGGDAARHFPDAPDAYARTARAMRAAIVFVTAHAGIPHFNLLPYKQPLVALAKFFDRYPEASPRSRDLLSRWLWRGAATGLHSADAASTRDAVKAIQGGENKTVRALLDTIGVPAFDLRSERGLPKYNFRHARTKMEVIALLSLAPRDLVAGTLLPVESLTSPAAVTAVAEGETIASRIVHPKIPKMRVALGRADAATRTSHAISDRAYEALLGGAIDVFVDIREQDLLAVIDRFLSSRTKYGVDNDRPPIGALRVSDED